MYNCSILKTLTYSPCKFAFRSFSQITTNLKVLPSVVTVEKWERDELLNYLQSVKNELKLDDDDIDIIEKQKVVGSDFLDLSEDELGKWGMSGGPAKRILKHVQKFPKKLKSFSAYRTNADIKDVLDKYRTNDIRNLSRFKPAMAKIEDSNENYQSCIELLKKRLKSMGELRGQKEALHSLYADTILIESTLIAQEITNKPIIIYPELEIIGVETSSDVDYAIKTSKISDNLEELICITETKRNTENIGTIQNILQLENAFYLNKMQKTDRDSKDYYDYIYGIVTTADKWSFLMYTPENIYLSEGSYPIKIDKEELRNSTELRKGLKQVMEIIVGLLKDRIEVDDSFASKKNRVKDILDNLTC